MIQRLSTVSLRGGRALAHPPLVTLPLPATRQRIRSERPGVDVTPPLPPARWDESEAPAGTTPERVCAVALTWSERSAASAAQRSERSAASARASEASERARGKVRPQFPAHFLSPFVLPKTKARTAARQRAMSREHAVPPEITLVHKNKRSCK